MLRASPLVPPNRPPASGFSIRTAKFGPVAPPVPRFRPDLGLNSSGDPTPPRPPGERSGSPDETKARETPRKLPARLVAPTCRREKPIVVLIASSSARCKSLPPVCIRRPRGELMSSSSAHASSSARTKGCRRSARRGRVAIHAAFNPRASHAYIRRSARREAYPVLHSPSTLPLLSRWRSTTTTAQPTTASPAGRSTRGRGTSSTRRGTPARRTRGLPAAGGGLVLAAYQSRRRLMATPSTSPSRRRG